MFNVNRPRPRVWELAAGMFYSKGPPLSADNLAALVTCCPNLREVHVSLDGTVTGESLQVLSELARLTDLSIGPVHATQLLHCASCQPVGGWCFFTSVLALPSRAKACCI